MSENISTAAEAAAGEKKAPDAGERAAEVVYGIQPDMAGNEAAQNEQPDAGAEPEKAEAEPRDKNAEWRKLIEGEYKDEFQKQTQGIINKRFREMKGLQEENARLAQLAEKLGDRYGVDPRDLKALSEAVDKDGGFLRDAADRSGMTVEQYRQAQQMKRENEYWRQQRQEAEKQRLEQEITRQWEAEEKQLREAYPTFSLDEELRNPDFVKLLSQGIPMEKAYQVMHYDQIMNGALRYAVNEAKAQTANTIRARALRPMEGAAGNAAAVTVKSDVTKLSKEDREEIARQVMRGKTITFS